MCPKYLRFRAAAAALLALMLLLAACEQAEPLAPTGEMSTATGAALAASPSAVIAVERAVVFPVPDRSAEPLTYLFQRERVPVLGQSADGTFWLVTIEDRQGWILAAQADRVDGGGALPVVSADTPAPTVAATPSPVPPSPTSTERPTPGPSRTPAPTRTPVPTSAVLDLPDASDTPAVPPIWPGTPPPLTLELPPGWQAAHILLPFRTPVTVREVPMSLYEGTLPGGASGHLYLFWGFPNVTTPSGEVNLWTDALQILRGSLVDQSCNLGIDLEQKTYRVGGHEAVGTLFSAVDCEGEPDTAGYFAALQVDGGNYAFFFAVEPPGAFADQFPALQAVLDSVRFEPPPDGNP